MWANGGCGFRISEGAAPHIIANQVYHNDPDGVKFEGKNSNGYLENNSIWSHDTGVSIGGGARPLVTGNKVHVNDVGICYLEGKEGGGGGRVLGNALWDNGVGVKERMSIHKFLTRFRACS